MATGTGMKPLRPRWVWRKPWPARTSPRANNQGGGNCAANETRFSKWKDAPMPAKSLFCIAISKAHADEIISRLQEAGFLDSDISVLFPYKARKRGLARQAIPEFCCARTGGLSGGGIAGV